MRPKLLILAIFVVGVAFAIERTMADFDGLIDIDDESDDLVSQISKRSTPVDNSDGEGDDEDDYGSVMSDESGSGSGEETTEPSIVDVSVLSPTTEETAATTKQTTTIDNEITESSEEPTEGSENEVTDEPTDGEGGDMLGGGVSETDPPNEQDSPNAEARVDEKSVLRVLTTEVIAAVVVGAVCAVILIAFLVYRLRKRDEGSYALSDAGYKDTYKLQGDTGKEAFV